MRGKRILVIAAVALAVASGMGATGYAVHKHNQCAPNQANAAAGSGRVGPTSGPEISVVGDSYASGMGLDNPRESWAFDFARATGTRTTIDAFPGTGYAIGGACGDHSFPNRVRSISSTSTTVIIEGGLNDAIFGTSSATLRTTARSILSDATERAPHARIVLVGPASPPDVSKASVLRVNSVLRSLAEHDGAIYVDLTSLRFHSSDGTHPDTDGHRLIARAVESAVSAD